MENAIVSEQKTVDPTGVTIETTTRSKYNETELRTILAQYDQRIYGLKQQMQNVRNQYDDAVNKRKGYEDSLNEFLTQNNTDMTVPA
jgi:predicted RNase H-like nuclease (RuvC/YqgF family)